jgi:hypothetical protein
MEFDIGRLRNSHRLIGGGGVALFIFLFFFKWYGVSFGGSLPGGVLGSASSSATGWDAFTSSRWIWLITIIVALGAVLIAAGTLKFESPVQLSIVVVGLGALSTVLIIYRIVHHPTASVPGFHAGIKIGIWLGLIAAAAITYGGYLAMNEEGTSLSDVREQASGALSNLSGQGTPPAAAPAPAGAASEPASPPIPPPASEPAADVAPPVPSSSPSPVSPPTPPLAAPPTSPPSPAGDSGEVPPSEPGF